MSHVSPINETQDAIWYQIYLSKDFEYFSMQQSRVYHLSRKLTPNVMLYNLYNTFYGCYIQSAAYLITHGS